MITLEALNIHTRVHIKGQHLHIETEQCMMTKNKSLYMVHPAEGSSN